MFPLGFRSAGKNLSLAAKRDSQRRAQRRQAKGKGKPQGMQGFIGLLRLYIDLTDQNIDGSKCRKQRYWTKEMQLFVADRQSIVAEEWLTDAVIDAAQVLLKEGFPEMGGLQRTTLGHTLTYAVERGEFVQIVNVRGNHWITIYWVPTESS